MFYPDRKADVVVQIKNSRPSKNIICSGYRPAFKVKEDYLTTGVIKFMDRESINYGEESLAEVWFITPEFYPSCLTVGQVISFQEGKVVNGYATIVKIYNKILEKQNI